jgi:hypothetical protein
MKTLFQGLLVLIIPLGLAAMTFAQDASTAALGLQQQMETERARLRQEAEERARRQAEAAAAQARWDADAADYARQQQAGTLAATGEELDAQHALRPAQMYLNANAPAKAQVVLDGVIAKFPKTAAADTARQWSLVMEKKPLPNPAPWSWTQYPL